MNEEVIVIKNLTKKFGNYKVLSNINLKLYKGEVCSIIGENGAGKSTLVKIISGIYQMDEGEMYFNGQKVNIRNINDAHKLGISLIQQDVNGLPHKTIYENLVLAIEPVNSNLFFPLFRKEVNAHISNILNFLDVDLHPYTRIADLTYTQMKIVEIAKALTIKSKLIIIDEPLSALAEQQNRGFFEILERMENVGISIVYISHRLEEVIKIADRIIVLREGEIVDTKNSREKVSTDYFIKKMAGEDYLNRYPKIKMAKGDGERLLCVEGLCNLKDTVKNINFEIRRGEIVGLAGLQGAGKSSVVNMIYGFEKKAAGNVFIKGELADIDEPFEAKRYGIAYIPENTSKNLFMFQTVPFNITIPKLDILSRLPFISKKRLLDIAREYIMKFNIKIPKKNCKANNLSSGNLQKLALAKWLFADSDIYIMDEPSNGLDVPSKVELYNIMDRIVSKGKCILLISSDMRELIGMSDRILVMFNGSIVKELQSSEASSEKILYYASGQSVHSSC